MSAFSSTKFAYDKNNKTFYVDMSDLDLGGRVAPFHQIYADAIDMGFSISSTISGKYVDYVIETEPTDEKNYWVLRPEPRSIRRVPEAQDTKVVVFNT